MPETKTTPQDTDTTQVKGHGYSTKAVGFHKKLREGTQALHDEAESGSFPVCLDSADKARTTLGTFLTQMKHVHATLDRAYLSAAACDSRFEQIFDQAHLRSHRIAQDLEDLKCPGNDPPSAATVAFASYIQECIETTPVSLIGVLYVKEGATNGNKFMAKRLRETLLLENDGAMGYLDPHGNDQRKRWNAFKKRLNELNLSEQEEDKCLEVAKKTFRMFMSISSETR